VDEIRDLLDAPAVVRMSTEKNFELARRYFSFELLEQRLRRLS
jgi:hypothetical protein